MLLTKIKLVILFLLINTVYSIDDLDNLRLWTPSYICDFDTDDCGATLTSSTLANGANFNIDNNQLVSLPSGATGVTDINSITKPTGASIDGPFDGPPCNIPYRFGTRSYYFCLSVGFCLPFQPFNNTRGYCDLGGFLWGRLNNIGNPYFGQLRISNIDLGEPGRFKFTFYAFMVCENFTTCILADDSLKLTINPDSIDPYEFSINYTTNDALEVKWEKMSFELTLDDPIIDFMVRFERLNVLSNLVFFGFDQLEIFKLEPDSTTEEEFLTRLEEEISESSFEPEISFNSESSLQSSESSTESTTESTKLPTTEWTTESTTESLSSSSDSSSSILPTSFSPGPTIDDSSSITTSLSQTQMSSDSSTQFLSSSSNSVSNSIETDLSTTPFATSSEVFSIPDESSISEQTFSTTIEPTDTSSLTGASNEPTKTSASTSPFGSTESFRSSSSFSPESSTKPNDSGMEFYVLLSIILGSIIGVLVICIVSYCIIKSFCLKPKVTVYPSNFVQMKQINL